ncbi:hypothetical protein [Wenzhouxiangella sp. EGI_FJ10305]|uniref:hypothetical protein n=1 Tax=Wenzhouxiangella sp. EGI_FJ10305 TaxID=3243768 RepID=UPI0035DD3069
MRHLVIALAFLGLILPVLASQSAITYQGQLQDAAGPVTDTHKMAFRLFDSETGDGQIGSEVSIAAVSVQDGLFEVELDFGSEAFSQRPRYLEIEVAGSVLEPRQRIAPAPTALSVLNMPEDLYWNRGGNAGTDPAVDFIGTTDDQPLEIRVDGQRVLRLEPAISANLFSPNWIGGSSSNEVEAGTVGATIAGGGRRDSPNVVSGAFGTIGGGMENTASSFTTTIGGGPSIPPAAPGQRLGAV